MSEDKEAIANSSQESTQEILKKILKKIHENGEGRSVYDLGNPALIAGTFDYLRLESQINDLLGKTADGRQNCGADKTSDNAASECTPPDALRHIVVHGEHTQ